MPARSTLFTILLPVLLVMGIIAAVIFGYIFFYRYPIGSTRAFKITSDSFCPSACLRERILARIDSFGSYHPQREDVVIMNFHSSILVKRVIGLPGDVISPGRNGAFEINGKTWQPPSICGRPEFLEMGNPGLEHIKFESTEVPAGFYFVIGDNLDHSYDSRIKEFGMVPERDIRGKALLIYYSPHFSRVGCPVR